MMIRRMTENDIDAVLELKAGEFQPAWNRDMLMSELKDNPFAQAYVLAFLTFGLPLKRRSSQISRLKQTDCVKA